MPVKPTPIIAITTALVLSVLSGCATYYQRTLKFQELFITERFEEAKVVLEQNRRAAKSKNNLLYEMQLGTTLYHMGSYVESNIAFENAYIISEDQRRNYAADAVSLLTNPEVSPYRGEDFELVLLHYYKTLNHLKLGDNENALVECRRLNIRLNELNDRHKQVKNRYYSDAFALNLMGIIFEATGDVNNAFISYRNAFNVYKDLYEDKFSVRAPLQLKRDLIRTAYLMGFTDEQQNYSKQFGIEPGKTDPESGNLVVLWHNGLGPVKGEWNLNFAIVEGQGGAVAFVNKDLGLSFAFAGGGRSSGGFGDLKFVRVAFPRYLERKPLYTRAKITTDKIDQNLELTEDVNAIAFTSLEDRLTRDLSSALLRLAVKQAAEYAVRKQNPNLGALLSIATAVAEKADTRNWQVLPHSIHYARLQLKAGSHRIQIQTTADSHNGANTEFYDVTIRRGETVFLVVHTIDSFPLSIGG